MFDIVKYTGRKCSAFTTSEMAVDLGDKLFNLATELEGRQAFFAKLRNEFPDLCARDLSKEEETFFKAGPAQTLLAILIQQITRYIETVTKVQSVSFVNVFLNTLANDAPKRINLWTANCDGHLVLHAQKSLVLTLVETSLRQPPHQISALAEALNHHVGGLPLVADHVLEAINDQRQVSFAALWHAQPYLDLRCYVAMGLVLDLGDKPAPQHLRSICQSLVKLQSSISGRLRAHFRNIHGAPTNHGKTAWDRIKAINDDAGTAREYCATTDIEVLKKHLTDLLAANEAGAEDVNNMFATWSDPENDVVRLIEALGKSYGDLTADAVSKSEAPYVQCCQEIAGALIKANEVILQHAGYHDRFFRRSVWEPPTTEEEDVSNMDLDFFKCQELLLGVSRAYHHIGGLDAVVSELAARAANLLTFHDSCEEMLQATRSDDVEKVVAVIAQWSDLWQKETGFRDQRSPNKVFSTGGAALSKFNNTIIDQNYVEKTIVAWATDLVTKEPKMMTDTPAALREMQRLEGVLPEDLGKIRFVAGVVGRLKETAHALSSGKQFTLIEMTNIMSEINDAERQAPKVMLTCSKECKQSVDQEWRRGIKAHILKMSNIKVANEYAAGDACKVFDCLDTMTFDKCPWITSNVAEPEQVALCKSVETVIAQYPNWVNLAQRCLGKMALWGGDLHTEFKAALAAAVDSKPMIEQAAKTLATNVMCFTLCQHPEQCDQMLKYIENVLHFRPSDLHKNIMTKIRTRDVAGAAGVGVSSGAQAADVPGNPTPATTAAAADQTQKPLRRQLRQVKKLQKDST